jgi:transposase
MLPAKADPDAQAHYVVEEVEPRLAQARAGQRAVFFGDAAHFVFAPFLGVLWSVTRIFLRAPAGRQRFTVWAALHAIPHDLLTVTNATYLTATAVSAFVWQLDALTLGVPLTVVLDNARSQRCAPVVTLAASLHLELCFLPPYSQHLNLLERLWKFVKKQCLYATYYADFAAFTTAIVQCLAQTQTTHRTALAALLTLRFQLFAKAQFFPV